MGIGNEPHVVTLMRLGQDEGFQLGERISLPTGFILQEAALEIRCQIQHRCCTRFDAVDRVHEGPHVDCCFRGSLWAGKELFVADQLAEALAGERLAALCMRLSYEVSCS